MMALYEITRHLLIIVDRKGFRPVVELYRTPEESLKAEADFCRENWDDQCEGKPIPDDDLAVTEQFFEDSEYEIIDEEIKFTVDEGELAKCPSSNST